MAVQKKNIEAEGTRGAVHWKLKLRLVACQVRGLPSAPQGLQACGTPPPPLQGQRDYRVAEKK
jgi:hypothetical protein